MIYRETAPLIGITLNRDYARNRLWLPPAYCRRVEEAGGIPVLIPPGHRSAREIWLHLHGLLLPGGGDIAPLFFGEEPRPGLGEVDPDRDQLELALVNEALRRDRPVLGICRGMQIINVAAGGSIIQHLSGEHYLQHSQRSPRCKPSHTVRILPVTRLASLLGEGVMAVNSFHHQAVAGLGAGLRESALAPDGVIEALESVNHRFIVAVQWHPESLDHPAGRILFQALVSAAARKI